ncbi:MAG: hypothetical protein QOG20_2533 [Pseudonocardiales bacterium]|jgi:hypothetical protein|nr:hypothetical protein [Pseudonocardiales bacterium]
MTWAAVLRRRRGARSTGVQTQRGEHREMGVEGVGLALPAASLAVGPLALDHHQAGGGDRAGKSHAAASRALDRRHHTRPRSVVDDPCQQLGIACGVVADLPCPDRGARRERDLDLVVSRWVSTPTTASTSSASMGTGLVRPAGSGSASAPARVGSPSGTSVTGHAHGRQASDQANRWARPVPATAADKSTARHAEAAGPLFRRVSTRANRPAIRSRSLSVSAAHRTDPGPWPTATA